MRSCKLTWTASAGRECAPTAATASPWSVTNNFSSAPYGYMAIAEEEEKIAAWREKFGRGSYDYTKEADWVSDLLDEKRVLTSAQAMEMLDISRSALFSFVRRGKLVRVVVCRGFGKRQALFSRDQVESLAADRNRRERRRCKTPAEWAYEGMRPCIRATVEAPPGDLLISRQEAAAILGVSLIRVTELVQQGRLFGWQRKPGRSGSRLWLSSNQVARYAASWDRVRRRAWREGTAIPGEHTQARIPGLMTSREEFIDEHRLEEGGTKSLERDHGEYFSTPQVARELGISYSGVVSLRKRGVLLGYHLRKRYGPNKHHGNPWWFYLKEDVWALKLDPKYAERSKRAREARRIPQSSDSAFLGGSEPANEPE